MIRRASKKRSPDGLPGFSGAEEIRTPDLLLAKETLYQLSHGPGLGPAQATGLCPTSGLNVTASVGGSGLEPEASALSGQCSNQLS
jgi:hypothetical protein